jgi:hypothetical protein
MAQFFSADYLYVWIVLLAALLFVPVRQLIWVLQVRRAQKKAGEIDAQEHARLKRRAGFSASLVCLIFAYFYVTMVLFAK